MDQIILRLEAIHRALRAAPDGFGCELRIAEAVADCLRELHAIAAQSADDARLRLIDCGSRRLH